MVIGSENMVYHFINYSYTFFLLSESFKAFLEYSENFFLIYLSIFLYSSFF